jgi:hypothetical protein
MNNKPIMPLLLSAWIWLLRQNEPRGTSTVGLGGSGAGGGLGLNVGRAMFSIKDDEAEGDADVLPTAFGQR